LRGEPASPTDAGQSSPRRAFARGLLLFFSVPSAVLLATALGFGALARDAGLTLGHAAFLAVSMNALPNQVVLADQLARNETLAAAALAVTLAAARLLPMAATLFPLVRTERPRRLLELLVAHFIAITTWIEGNRRLPDLPRELRLSHYLGMGVAISTAMVLGTVTGYGLAVGVPIVVMSALLFLTPLYFVLSLFATSRRRVDISAIVLGGVLGSVFFLLLPGLDLLATGLVAGTLAFAVGRARRAAPLPSQE
jgi:predicted branched-subunit amino acid permease